MDEKIDPNAGKHILNELASGGLAGAMGVFIGFPLDLIKVRLQVNASKYKGAFDCVKKTIVEDGLAGFYRGWIPPVVATGFVNALVFTGEHIAMSFLQPDLKRDEVGSPTNTFLAGCFGGIFQLVLLVPSEVVKCTMQVETTFSSPAKALKSGSLTPQNYATPPKNSHAFSETMRSMKKIYRKEGMMGFYKGTGATAMREIPSIGIYFFTYKNSREMIRKLEGREEASTMSTLVAGSLAGCGSWIMVYPLDMIKTHMQTPVHAEPVQYQYKQYGGANGLAGAANLRGLVTNFRKHEEQKKVNYGKLHMSDVVANIYNQHGFRGFFRGLGTTVVRAIPVNAATFYFYELFKEEFHYHLM